MKKDIASPKKVLLALVLLTVLMATVPSFAQAGERNRKGLFLGLNAGWGSAGFSTQIGDQTISDDPYSGGAGALRFGYAFSNSVALSLEGHGFGTDDSNDGWGLGASFLTFTWWPDGSGFFLRLGGGVGGGDIQTRGTGALIHFEDAPAGLFGLGYEWQLGRKFALGLAFDGIGFEVDRVPNLVEEYVGLGNFTVQFNWYL